MDGGRRGGGAVSSDGGDVSAISNKATAYITNETRRGRGDDGDVDGGTSDGSARTTRTTYDARTSAAARTTAASIRDGRCESDGTEEEGGAINGMYDEF